MKVRHILMLMTSTIGLYIQTALIYVGGILPSAALHNKLRQVDGNTLAITWSGFIRGGKSKLSSSDITSCFSHEKTLEHLCYRTMSFEPVSKQRWQMVQGIYCNRMEIL